jgi:hypothetical protein
VTHARPFSLVLTGRVRRSSAVVALALVTLAGALAPAAVRAAHADIMEGTITVISSGR